ncbi:BadF/BadG/BcrA/BcrD ATPase family protein [Deinococcus sp. VB343]|uniref:BadF/BadG/BcrA/BcrD ATPase family protein n=1 Tax=Deinococcus sp. VB142 TaxID=3112952 RepID=A0AAU6Q7L5_9DEIO
MPCHTPPATLPFALGLDAGGSGTQWVLLRGGQRVGGGTVAPLTSALLPTPAGEAALHALRDALPRPRPHTLKLHAGLPGLSTGTPQASAARQTLAAALGLGPEQVTVESDLDLAYRTHFAPGEGVLVYAGTGSIAYHVTAGGKRLRAGGRGYRIGDDGAGASLGRWALRHLTDALDFGAEATGPLATEVAAITGGLDWDTLRAYTYAAPGASALARLAPAVGRAADQGDPAALALLRRAAEALAELGRRVQTRAGAVPVRFTGGALRASPLFVTFVGEAFPDAEVAWRDHAEAAARVAAEGFTRKAPPS